jgi:ABC-type branched-subunit amino acid transport system ATPase component
MISFSNINKQYGKQLLFVDASFQLNPGEKVGLVGPDGAGRQRSSGRFEPGSGSWVSVVTHVVPPTAKCVYNQAMQEPFTRDRIIEALQAMPPNATIDDAIERLVFLAKVETGLAELDGSQGIPHDQAKHRFGL